MDTPVEVVNTASKVGLKFDKTTLIAGSIGLVVGAGVIFGTQKLKERARVKKFDKQFGSEDQAS